MNGIEITEVASKGRGLIATKKFETGRLVLGEEPYAYVIMSNYVDKVCHFCLRSTHVVSMNSSLAWEDFSSGGKANLLSIWSRIFLVI